MTDFNGEDFPSAEDVSEAMDKIDLWMPELMAEAAEVKEWDEFSAFNFIRRAYAKGRIDAFDIMAQEPGNEQVE